MANTSGEKELRRDWPHESGLISETTKQEGRQRNLIPERGSTVQKEDRETGDGIE